MGDCTGPWFCWVLASGLSDFSLLLRRVGGAALPKNGSASSLFGEAEGYLNGRLGVWQQRLNLPEWKISVTMVRANELKPQTLGNIHWDIKPKTANIRVLDASDYHVSCPDAVADMEMTVVHELVHLDLSSLPRSTASRREEEFAVNRIAEALMGLDRHSPVATTTTEVDSRAATTDSKPDAARSRPDAPASHP